MATESALESEDLENVPLVRMEDVQPDRTCELTTDCDSDEVFETCIVDDTNYEECVVDDDDSNIGSMVSVKSEEVEYEETELIVPEVLEPLEVPIEIEEVPKMVTAVGPKPNRPDSWPTLEILPGGVINLADKTDVNVNPNPADQEVVSEVEEMMYACAKCSQSFKYLFCLVKHVKWHEEEEKKLNFDMKNLTPIEKKMADLKRRTLEQEKNYKKQKVKLVSEQTEKTKYICLHSEKRKIISKTNSRKVPKKS